MPSNTEKIEDALRKYAYCLANHKECGSQFDYEKYARERFKEQGPGFVLLELSDFVRGFIEEDPGEVEILHKYALLDSLKNKDISAKLEKIIKYEPQKQYAAFLLVETKKLPRALSFGTAKNIMLISQIPIAQALVPSRITTAQIRKRLTRMAQQGVRLLVLDTTEPDCMGPNLGKWLKEIKTLENQGKYFATIIDGDGYSSDSIPEYLKEDICTLTFK